MCIPIHCGYYINEISQSPVYLDQDKLQWYSQIKYSRHLYNNCCHVTRTGCVIYNNIITQFDFAQTVYTLRLVVTHGFSVILHLYGDYMIW